MNLFGKIYSWEQAVSFVMAAVILGFFLAGVTVIVIDAETGHVPVTHSPSHS